jgi:aryl-alcohol dehydrogenase-like predicted oxidoreductase
LQADIYSHGQSERIIGKALKKYNIPRSKVVLLSKCYFGVDESNLGRPIALSSINDGETVNEVGLSRKHIFDAVEKSVERLGTYIDVLQIHRLDRSTPREEIMKALNDVIEKGWVRYIGASSMAAWEFQTLQNIAEKHGWHKFVSMQNYYNLLYREEEREMVRACRVFNLCKSANLARSLIVKTRASDSFHGHLLHAALSHVPLQTDPPSVPKPTNSCLRLYTTVNLLPTRKSSSVWKRSPRNTT